MCKFYVDTAATTSASTADAFRNWTDYKAIQALLYLREELPEKLLAARGVQKVYLRLDTGFVSACIDFGLFIVKNFKYLRKLELQVCGFLEESFGNAEDLIEKVNMTLVEKARLSRIWAGSDDVDDPETNPNSRKRSETWFWEGEGRKPLRLAESK